MRERRSTDLSGDKEGNDTTHPGIFFANQKGEPAPCGVSGRGGCPTPKRSFLPPFRNGGAGFFLSLLIIKFFSFPSPGWAEETSLPSSFPVLLSSPVVEYPQGVSPGVKGRVKVRFSILPEGKVTDIVVLESNDPHFEEPVTRALRETLFSPRPLKEGILVVETWVEVEPPPVSGSGDIKGKVYAFGSRYPLSQVEIRLEGVAPPLPVTYTDADGRFFLSGIPPGDVTVVVVAPGFRKGVFLEKVRAGESLTVEYRLFPLTPYPLEVVVEGEKPRQEISRVTLKTKEIRAVPGTLDDPLRVSQKLPGVAVPSELSGQLLVRGSDARDTRIFVDDIPVLILYHFGALKSVFTSELIEDVNLYPSNFSVRYGDTLGGVLDVRLRDPDSRLWKGRVQITTLLAEGNVEGPLTSSVGILVGARRSYAETFLRAVLPSSLGLDLTVVPQFYDYQGRGVYRKGPIRMRTTLFGSRDRFVFLLDPQRNLFKDFFGGVDFRLEQHAQIFSMEYERDGFTSTTVFATRITLQDTYLGNDLFFRLRQFGGFFRQEWLFSLPLGEGVFGLEGRFPQVRAEYEIPRPPRPGEFDYDFIQAPRIQGKVGYTPDREGGYGEWRVKLFPFSGRIGVRGDRDGRSGIFTGEPRVAGEYTVEGLGTLKGGVGVVHQFAQLQENAPVIGRKDVGPSRGVHLLLGFSAPLWEKVEGKVEGFYKWMDHLIVQASDPTLPFRYYNTGKGRAYGVEITLFRPLFSRFFGWFNYSFTRSFRKSSSSSSEEPFRYDQPHIINGVLSYYPSSHWEFGTSFRYASGVPATVVGDKIYVADQAIWYPISYRSDRLPSYFRLDGRVKYTWFFPTWNLSLLLEILNMTAHRNILGVTYNRDYTERRYIESFPVLPYLGVEGQW